MKSGTKFALGMLLLTVTGVAVAENEVLPPDEITYQMAIQAFGVSEQSAQAAARMAAEEAARLTGEDVFPNLIED